MGIQAPAKVKFKIIHDVLAKDSNMLTVRHLCKIAGVSRSGYYSWEENEENRKLREDRDLYDFHKIKEAQKYRYIKGVRGVLKLPHVENQSRRTNLS